MTTPTLDADRVALLTDFLVSEAAGEAADETIGNIVTLVPPRHTGRRVAIATAAAVVLGGALFVGNVVVGGPGPATVDAASAVAFVPDGEWTTIRLQDRDASPQTVLDELLAAGFDARIERMEVTTDLGVDGYLTVQMVDPGTGPGTMTSGAGSQGLVGLSVALPPGTGDHPPVGEPSSGTEATSGATDAGPSTEVGPGGERPATVAAVDAWNEEHGFRVEDDGSISLRTGADLTVVVFVARV